MDDLQTLNLIHNMIKKWLQDGVVDTEQLAIDIWMELWVKGNMKPTRWLVLARCRDALRKLRRRPKIEIELDREDQDFGLPSYGVEDIASLDTREIINKLMILVEDKRDRMFIFLRFYRELTFAEIGEAMGVSREQARLIIR